MIAVKTKSYPNLQIGTWCLSSVAAGLAILAWAYSSKGLFENFNNYTLFPLFGLMAFSIMWSHYISSFVRQLVEAPKEALKTYFDWTAYAVLFLILAHPSLLIYQLYRDGAGLPPGSYQNFVGRRLAWVAFLGTASLVVFLAFELRHWFADRKWWPWVTNASDLAMLATLYHGYKLGSAFRLVWFKYVWLFYTITLVICLVYKYSRLVKMKLA